MSNVAEISPTPSEQENRAEFGQVRTFAWQSFSVSSTRGWVVFYLAGFFVTLSANYGVNWLQNSRPTAASESSSLFMKDRELFWKMRPDSNVIFGHTMVRTNHHGFRGDDPVPGRRVVLCLGDSIPFGWGVDQTESFPAQLQARLNAATKSGRPWAVINAAVPSYSSFQCRLVAERLVPRWKPEVVVFCGGGADPVRAEQSDRQTNADRAMNLFGVILEERGFSIRDPKCTVPRCTREEFADNLREIARITRSAGAKLLVVGTSVNLQSLNGLSSEFPGGAQGKVFFESVMQVLRQEGLKKALKKAEAALAENPNNCYALAVEGLLLAMARDTDTAEELLEQAIEQYPIPMMSARSFRQAAAEVAREENVPYLNTTDTLFRRSVASPSKRLFVDAGHLSAGGHAVIADWLFEAIMGQKAPAKVGAEQVRAGKAVPSTSRTLPGAPSLPASQ
jgi:lysophospholipase L1-like esterase